MTEAIRVVARFADGRVIKGTTHDFLPNRPSFHLIPAHGSPPVEVRCEQLKALFVVKNLEGDPERANIRGFIDARVTAAQGKKIAVLFKDGEFMCGHTLSYQPGREGFFLFPVDAESNNLRVYVVMAATKEIKSGAAAEDLATSVLSSSDRSPRKT